MLDSNALHTPVRDQHASRYNWSRLTPLQVGRYGEYFVKMEFTMYGFDVYTSEVDDRGIDFVVRKDAQHYFDIQVKTVRSLNYIYFVKRKFEIAPNRYIGLVLLNDGCLPDLYLLPTANWRSPDSLFVDRNYEGLKSEPEWGLQLSLGKISALAQFTFESVVSTL